MHGHTACTRDHTHTHTHTHTHGTHGTHTAHTRATRTRARSNAFEHVVDRCGLLVQYFKAHGSEAVHNVDALLLMESMDVIGACVVLFPSRFFFRQCVCDAAADDIDALLLMESMDVIGACVVLFFVMFFPAECVLLLLLTTSTRCC